MAESEAGVEPAKPVEAPAVREKIQALPPDPYEKSVLTSIQKFFRDRAKKPSNFTFTNTGNLQIKDPLGTIQLKRFIPLEPSERAALEQYRIDTLSELEEAYTSEIQALRQAWDAYHQTGAMRPVLAANQRVAELDIRRNAIRSAVRDIIPIENISTNKIIFEEKYEVRKIIDKGDDPFDKQLMRLFFYDFKAEHDQGKYVVGDDETKIEEVEELSELEYRKTLKDGRKARIFYDVDSDVNGFLSPMWPVNFTMDDTQYFTGIQAYEAERAKEMGMMDLRASILKTRSPRTIRLMVMKRKMAHPADAKGLWLKIFTNIYQQAETLKEKLLATETDALVYADIREGPSGIGLAEKDTGVLDPSKWKGENIVGLALETLRTQLREGNAEEAPMNAAPKERVISEEQQANAKVGAIINARKRA
jgi:hypothetical protein